MRRIYLVDFDGTITTKDTLDYIAKKFFPLEYKEWGEKLMKGKISIKDWIHSFESKFEIEKNVYDNLFREEIHIDETFVEFAKQNKVVIVSGGLNYNIRKILEFYNISDIEIYANNLTFIAPEFKKIKIEMPFLNESCQKCGVCKNLIIKKYKNNYDEVVFIGDGITDICASMSSDRVFAKKGLYLDSYLNKKGISHFTFETFKEIV